MAFTTRLPKQVDSKLKAEAKANRRPKLQQLITILEERYGLKPHLSKRESKAEAT